MSQDIFYATNQEERSVLIVIVLTTVLLVVHTSLAALVTCIVLQYLCFYVPIFSKQLEMRTMLYLRIIGIYHCGKLLMLKLSWM